MKIAYSGRMQIFKITYKWWGLFSIYLCTTLLLITGCSSHHGNATKADTDTIAKPLAGVDPQPKKVDSLASRVKDTVMVRELKYGFTVKLGASGNCEIFHFNKRIYSDTSKEYTFDNKNYPILKKIDTNFYQLLLEIDERPSKNLSAVLEIKTDKVTRGKQIPMFDDEPKIINGKLAYNGFWDYGEDWDVKGIRYTVYNPRLYYVFTDKGIVIDTELTITGIKEIYGKFRGFQYSSKFGYPVNEKGDIIDTADKHVLKEKD